MDETVGKPVVGPGGEAAPSDARPTTALTIAQLFQISVFWFALNTIWGGFELFQGSGSTS